MSSQVWIVIVENFGIVEGIAGANLIICKNNKNKRQEFIF